MKTQEIYIADDGSRFDKKSDCLNYESIAKRLESILSNLPKRPDGCDFANGSGYIQHKRANFEIAKIEVLKVIKSVISHKWIQEAIDKTVHPSYVSRLVGETNNSAIQNAWYRFYCTDSEYREWGQPFFAKDNSGAKKVQLNK